MFGNQQYLNGHQYNIIIQLYIVHVHFWWHKIPSLVFKECFMIDN